MNGEYANAVLHFGEREYVVLGFWKMGSGLGLAASMLVVALVAVLHEAVLGLRFLRERADQLQQKQPPLPARMDDSAVQGQPASSRNYVNQPATAQQEKTKTKVRSEVKDIFRRIFSRSRLLQALLYLVQWTLFVFAFVLVPCGTFNIPLILAALLGKTLGYLIFIGSPALESVERLPPSSPSGTSADGQIRLSATATSKSLRSF